MARTSLLLVALLALGVLMVAVWPAVDASFEMACMEKCEKVKQCRKFGPVALDYQCNRRCKKKCYKVRSLAETTLSPAVVIANSLANSPSGNHNNDSTWPYAIIVIIDRVRFPICSARRY